MKTASNLLILLAVCLLAAALICYDKPFFIPLLCVGAIVLCFGCVFAACARKKPSETPPTDEPPEKK